MLNALSGTDRSAFLAGQPLSRGCRALLGLLAICLVLTVGRGILSRNWWSFVMLNWNLALALFPLGVALVLRDLRNAAPAPAWFGSRRLLVGGLMVWLLFLPNAPYIITDLFHLPELQVFQAALLWFDTLTIYVYATTGLLCGLYSSLLVHRMVKPLLGVSRSWALLLACQFLSGFGIYLGRFGRWNSWNVLSEPAGLLRAIVRSYQDHLSLKLTLAYGFVLAAGYLAFWWYAEDSHPHEIVA